MHRAREKSEPYFRPKAVVAGGGFLGIPIRLHFSSLPSKQRNGN